MLLSLSAVGNFSYRMLSVHNVHGTSLSFDVSSCVEKLQMARHMRLPNDVCFRARYFVHDLIGKKEDNFLQLVVDNFTAPGDSGRRADISLLL